MEFRFVRQQFQILAVADFDDAGAGCRLAIEIGF